MRTFATALVALSLLAVASAHVPALLSVDAAAPLFDASLATSVNWEDCGSRGAEIHDVLIGSGFMRVSFTTTMDVTSPAPMTMKATTRDGSSVDFPPGDLCQLGLPCPIRPSPLVLNLRTQSSWATFQFETDTAGQKLLCFKVTFPDASIQVLPQMPEVQLEVAPVDLAWQLRSTKRAEWKDCGSTRAVVDDVVFRAGQVTIMFQNTQPIESPSPIEITVDGRTQNADFCRIGLPCPIPPQSLQLSLSLGTASTARFESWHLQRVGPVILCVDMQL